MADSGSAGATRDPFENIISLVAGPIAAVIRSFDQLRRGSDELFKGLENFNRTMNNLNDTAERVNALLNEFEEPARAVLPQVLATARLAEDLATRVSGPIDQLVPGLTRLADTLSSPAFKSLPTDLSGFVDAINDLVRRLAPLGQIAESAGGLFGLRLPGFSRSAMTPPMLESVIEPAPKEASAKKAAPKKVTAKKVTAKKSAKKRPHQRRRRARRPRRARRGDVTQRLTKGVATTEAGSSVPRTSTTTSAPTSIVGGTNPRAMPWPSVGEKFPDVTEPTMASSTMIGHPARGGRRPATAMPDETTVDSPGLFGGECSSPPKLTLGPGDNPPETRLERGDAGAELVAVQRQGSFQTQCVTSAESRSLDASGCQRFPQCRGGRGRHGDLDTRLARVARAGDRAVDAVPHGMTDAEPADRRGLRPHRRQALLGGWALNGEHGALVGRLTTTDGGNDAVRVRRVGHHVESCW